MPPKRALWTEANLQSAMLAVQRGQLTTRTAAVRYNIPRRTLRNHLKSGITLKKLGRCSIMSIEQEKDLVSRIVRFANIGMPLTPRLIRRQAFIFCEANKLNHNFSKESGLAGRDWLKAFMKRNPQISKRKAQFMNPGRAQKLNRAIVSQHFEGLQKIYEELDIAHHPERLYNIDEKGCRLTIHSQQTVLAQKGARRVHLIAPEHAENVTIVMCVNAIGSAIPPMLIFKGQRMKPEYNDNLPPGSIVKMAPKGSMTTELFVEFIKHLAKYKSQGKTLLIFDGASSHLDYTIVDEADKHDIVLYCLPSNTTHELQPLDKSVNRSYEHHWDQEVLKFMYQNPERRLNKTSFNRIFSSVWAKCMTHEIILNGFKATGLYPFNADILPDEAYAPSVLTELPPPEPYSDTTEEVRDEVRRVSLGSPSILEEEDPGWLSENNNPNRFISNAADECENNLTLQSDLQTTNENEITPAHSPQPSTSFQGMKRLQYRPIIYSSDSETDVENEHIEQPLSSCYRAVNIYAAEEDHDDFDNGMLLSSPKTKEIKSPFQQLLPTPNYAVIKQRPRRKAINYKGQQITKDLFKDREKNKNQKRTTKDQKNTKKTSKEVKKRRKFETNPDKGKGEGKKSKPPIEYNEEWFCHACKENYVSDMRQCVQCNMWYHEECVGLTKEDKEAFNCQECDN